MTRSTKRFVLCIANGGVEASLTKGKIYQALPTPADRKAGFLRVVDNDLEDYLFPAEMFQDVELSDGAVVALAPGKRAPRGARSS